MRPRDAAGRTTDRTHMTPFAPAVGFRFKNENHSLGCFQAGGLVPFIGLNGEGVFAGGEVAKGRGPASQASLCLAVNPVGVADANGIFFIPWAQEGKSNKTTEDPPRP